MQNTGPEAANRLKKIFREKETSKKELVIRTEKVIPSKSSSKNNFKGFKYNQSKPFDYSDVTSFKKRVGFR